MWAVLIAIQFALQFALQLVQGEGGEIRFGAGARAVCAGGVCVTLGTGAGTGAGGHARGMRGEGAAMQVLTPPLTSDTRR